MKHAFGVGYEPIQCQDMDTKQRAGKNEKKLLERNKYYDVQQIFKQ
jgi:hypothetical protein